MALKVKSLDDFVADINQIVFEEDCTTIEAICLYSEKNGVDFDRIAPYIEQSFKDVIRNEAENRNLLKRENVRLPI